MWHLPRFDAWGAENGLTFNQPCVHAASVYRQNELREVLFVRSSLKWGEKRVLPEERTEYQAWKTIFVYAAPAYIGEEGDALRFIQAGQSTLVPLGRICGKSALDTFSRANASWETAVSGESTSAFAVRKA